MAQNMNDSKSKNFKVGANDLLDSNQQNLCVDSFQSAIGDKRRGAIFESKEALKNLDGGKNMVKTQKNINFKSIFKMNNM